MSKQVHLLRTYYPHWGKYSGPNRFIEYVDPEKFSFNDQAVPMGEDNFPISSVRVRERLKRWITKNGVQAYNLNDLVAEIAAWGQWLQGRVDIFHYLDGEHSLQYLPSLVRKFSFLKARPPIIATFHQPASQLDSFLNIDIVRCLDHVSVVSPEQVPYFEQYLGKNQISVTLLGIDIDYFQPRTELKDKGKLKCLSVGHWLRDYDTVLAAARKLQGHPEIEFHIVSSKVKISSDQENIYIYKGIDDAALLKIYQQCNVLFLPLFSATANNAIVEAIACGLPVLSTDLLSVRAYVPGQEAILVPENDPELFAKRLLNLYHHPETLAQMAQYARQRAVELSWQNIAPQFEAIYSKVYLEKKAKAKR